MKWSDDRMIVAFLLMMLIFFSAMLVFGGLVTYKYGKLAGLEECQEKAGEMLKQYSVRMSADDFCLYAVQAKLMKTCIVNDTTTEVQQDGRLTQYADGSDTRSKQY